MLKRIFFWFIVYSLWLMANTPAYADAFNFLDEPWTDVGPTTDGSWTDVDVSSYIPAGSTGVILKVQNTNTSDRTFGVRMNGSTDNRTTAMFRQSHTYAFVGVDSSRIFECYTQFDTDFNVYLVGYTLDGVTFLTNATNYTLSSTSTWTDIDITADSGGNAIGAIIEVAGAASGSGWGLRNNGSTDNRANGLCCNVGNHYWFIVGVDSSEILEGQVANTAVGFFLTGYVTKGATFLTNATNYQTATTASYEDVDITADSSGQATGAFVEINDTVAPFDDYALRWNGSSEDVYDNLGHHSFAFIQVDSGEVFEQKIASADVDIFLIGWSKKSRVMLMDQ